MARRTKAGHGRARKRRPKGGNATAQTGAGGLKCRCGGTQEPLTPIELEIANSEGMGVFYCRSCDHDTFVTKGEISNYRRRYKDTVTKKIQTSIWCPVYW